MTSLCAGLRPLRFHANLMCVLRVAQSNGEGGRGQKETGHRTTPGTPTQHFRERECVDAFAYQSTTCV